MALKSSGKIADSRKLSKPKGMQLRGKRVLSFTNFRSEGIPFPRLIPGLFMYRSIYLVNKGEITMLNQWFSVFHSCCEQTTPKHKNAINFNMYINLNLV